MVKFEQLLIDTGWTGEVERLPRGMKVPQRMGRFFGASVTCEKRIPHRTRGLLLT